MDEEKIVRIERELKAVGVKRLGLITPESKTLARLLHDDEHIGGVVYGTYSGGLAWLIATDRRVLFIDRKPLFSSTDELTYDVVSGVKRVRAGLFSSVILHTRVGDYSIRFVNVTCARTFVQFIESRRLEDSSGNLPEDEPVPSFRNDGEALDFLKTHDLAVLSTTDRTGNVHGAIVYYTIDQNNFIYILTKSETGKGHNIYVHSQVALTIYEPDTMQTLQLQGIAGVETDQTTKEKVFAQIVKPRSYKSGTQLPPVVKLHEGSFMVIKINPTHISFHDYDKTE